LSIIYLAAYIERACSLLFAVMRSTFEYRVSTWGVPVEPPKEKLRT